ncbi:MAG TPA: hypothetical protein VF329_05385 [Gammaproteobacteria bacterium]
MTAIVRLVWTYFTGTRLGRWLSLAGLSAMMVGNIGAALAPSWTLDPTGRLDAQGSFFVFLPWPAVIAVLFASALMPVMLDRMMRGRRLGVLPHGRLRLLASAVGTAASISLATAGTAVLAFYRFPIEISFAAVFVRTFAVAFTTFGFTYLALWMLGKMRGGTGLLAAALLVMLSIGLPLTYMDEPTDALPWPVKLGFIGWIAFGAVLLAGHRAASVRAAVHGWLTATLRRLPSLAYAEGMEASLLLGTSRPWILAIGQAVPIGIAAAYIAVPSVWLFFFTLFGAITAAVTSHAAARSRTLWLRAGLTRAELFRRVERAYWRYNGYALGVLLALLVGFGALYEYPARLVVFGPPLVVLGAAASFYLGMIMTKGLGLIEGVLGVSTMGLLMAASVATARADVDIAVVIALGAAIALLALVYRACAAARWNGLDWMLCRGETFMRGRAA